MKKNSVFFRIVTLLMVAVVCFTSMTVFPVLADDILYGDVDGDGSVGAADLLRLRKYLAGMDYTTGLSDVVIFCGADVNGNESVGTEDCLLLCRYFAAFNYETGKSSVLLGPDSENNINLPVDSDIMNVLIIGTDALTATANGRSDAMIIATINPANKRIVLTSVLRDQYVFIPIVSKTYPNGTHNKINAAHSLGGTPLLEKTIEETWGIHIDRFIRARYQDFMKVFQYLGGVEISLSQKEVEYINHGLKQDKNLLNIIAQFDAEGFPLTKTDELPLDIVGKKTNLNPDALLVYARARKIVYSASDPMCKGTEIKNGADLGRTDRQRLILTRAIEKVKKMSLPEMFKLLEECLPCIVTDLTLDEFRYFINNSSKFMDFTVDGIRFPCSGSWQYGHTPNGTSILEILEGGIDKMKALWNSKVYG